jgi:hypothetical protein
MKGYAVDPSGPYVKFLDELEESIQTAWKRTDIHYWKFGTKVRELSRDALRSGVRTPEFYMEHGMSEVTGIDQVINCSSKSGVSVIITDLFQREGDVNAIVSRVKDQCFARGMSVAVLGIKSPFNGTVYDAKVPPSYQYVSKAGDPATYRAFYALMFGRKSDLNRLFESLKVQPYIGDRSFVLISNQIMRSYQVTMAKDPASKAVNTRKPAGPYEFNFDLRSGQTKGVMSADVTFTLDPNAPDFHADRVELVAYRRTVGGKGAAAGKATDSTETRDITLQHVTRTGNTLHAKLALDVSDPPGTYSYQLLLRTGAINGFDVPPWVRQFSSDNPTPQNDPNKTLNFAPFVSNLRRASSAVYQPLVAKWYVTIRKL